jgi:3-methyl-2-oxobutanoate hydroxymethyltransferase
MASAVTLMQAGAHMVKLEGGGWTTETVRFLAERGIPVCAHLGLTPQSVHALGGWRQGQCLRGHAVVGLEDGVHLGAVDQGQVAQVLVAHHAAADEAVADGGARDGGHGSGGFTVWGGLQRQRAV